MNSNKMSVKVSVVVCTYRQEETIARTLDSILSQKTVFPYEIIIGEDSSPDGTRIICEEYAGKYPDLIKLMPASPNKGLLKNYRDCVNECKGDYLMACAGDDWWSDSNKIQLQVECMEKNPDCVMCYTGSIRHNVKIGTVTEIPVVTVQEDLFRSLLKVDYVCAPTMCIRKSVFDKVSLDSYIQKGYPMEDYPMLLEMANMGSFYPLDVLSVTYTHSSDSASTFKTLEKQVEFENAVQRVRKDMVEKYDRCAEFPDSVLDDIYYRNLFSHGIKFGNRSFSFKSIMKVKAKNSRDWLKLFMASNALTYAILRKRNRKYATI